MRFKKTSILGVVLSLALVFGVTAAFASDPIDKDAPVSGPDASGTPLPDGAQDIQSDLPAVDPDDVDLSMMRERLAQQVADGELTQEQADEKLAAMEQMLEQARRGELKLFFYDEGGCILGSDIFEVNEDLFADLDNGLDQLYIKDENGDLVPVAPGTVTDSFVDMDDSGLTDVEIRTSSGPYVLCDAEDCQETEPHCHIDGMVVRVYQEYPGLLCARPDCEEEDVHEHDGVTYYGQAGSFTILDPELGPVPSALPEQAAPTAAQLTTAPVQSDCPVEGCTVQGSHHHGDTFYTCNGHHSGGVCDGSCLASLPSTVSDHHGNHH